MTENKTGIVVEGLKDAPLVFGMVFFKHHFRLLPPPDFHQIILQASLDHRLLAIQSPRGSAKSTILTFLRSAHGIAFKLFRFIVIVQNTMKKATGSLDTIKREFTENEAMKQQFGVTLERDATDDSVFVHPDGFKTRVLCKGSEQIGSVRGEKFGAYRSDLIIIDDLEDDEMVKNPVRRTDLKSLYDDALIPAGEPGKTRVFAIGTILHDDSLMAKLVSTEEYPEYFKLFFKARFHDRITGELASLWKEKWSLEHLKQLEKDKPSVFAKEFQGDPTTGLMSKFSRADFRYWRREGLAYILYDGEGEICGRGELSDCVSAIACDLAWEERKVHDYSVIMPGYLTPNSELLIGRYICEKGLRPHKMEEIIFTMEEKLSNETHYFVKIGFEKAKLEKVARWFLKEAMKRRNHILSLRDLEWTGDKVERVVTKLEPRYKMHMVYHMKGMGDLEQQLVRFPSGAHDDLPDAEQGLVQLLKYPKQRRKEEPTKEDETFNKLRNFMKRKKGEHIPTGKPYVFGHKEKFNKMGCEISPLE